MVTNRKELGRTGNGVLRESEGRKRSGKVECRKGVLWRGGGLRSNETGEDWIVRSREGAGLSREVSVKGRWALFGSVSAVSGAVSEGEGRVMAKERSGE